MPPNPSNQNSIISLSHFPLTLTQANTRLTTDLASGSGTLTVSNISGFAINQVLLIGNFGDESAEIVLTSASVAPSGFTVTLVGTTVYSHTIDTPITVIGYNQVEFSCATTLTGAKSVLATQNISADETATGYLDLVNNTGYGFARFKNTINGFFSDYSDAVPYSGSPVNSVQSIITKAIKDCGNVLNDDFANELDVINDCQEGQDEVAAARDWAFELYKNTTSIVTINGETEYDLSGLSMKYDDQAQSLLSVRLGNMPLNAVAYQQIEDAQACSNTGSLTADATVGATSITLDSTDSFQDQGNVYLRENGFVAYTANNKTTNVLSGIDPTAIATLVPTGATVWQNYYVGKPTSCAVIDGNLELDIPPDTTNSGINLKFRFLRKLPSLTSFSSTTLVPFPKVISYYVSSCIERRKRNLDESDRYLALFNAKVAEQAARFKLQLRRGQQVYGFNNTAGIGDDNDWDNWYWNS